MSLLSSTIPNLVNGISQQPPNIRLASQGETQINGMSNVAKGLTKRPPTQHLAALFNTNITDALIHTLDLGSDGRYVALFTNGDLRLFNADTGAEQTITFTLGKTYLQGTGSPKDFLRVMTAGDYTFVVNNQVTVTEGSLTQLDSTRGAILQIKNPAYGRTYRIRIYNSSGSNIATGTFSTPDGSVSAHAAQLDGEYILTQLITSLQTSFIAAGGGSLFANYKGSTAYLDYSAAAAYNFIGGISVEDGTGGTNLTVVASGPNIVGVGGSVTRFADLPSNSGVFAQIYGTNHVIKVAGDTEVGQDDFYVALQADGSWKEVLKPGLVRNITGMPYALTKEVSGFKFSVVDWTYRTVGDNDTNPMPTFVGKKIENVFFFRNRLGFLSGESVIMSESSAPFNFFRTSVLSLLDADPIDIAVNHVRESRLLHAVPHNRQLILFSQNTQFVLEGGEALTPTNVDVRVVTDYETSGVVPPIGIGKHLYFAFNRGDYLGFREAFFDVDNLNSRTEDITGHLPAYIPNTIRQVSAASNHNMMVAFPGSGSSVYVYQFYWAGNDKLQSAWHTWDFNENASVLGGGFIGSRLYLVINRGGSIFFEVIDISEGWKQDEPPVPLFFDRWDIQYPWDSSTNLLYAHVEPEAGETWWGYIIDGPYAGELHQLGWSQSNFAFTIPRFVGNDNRVMVGTSYPFTYRFSTVAFRFGDKKVGTTDGRTQLRSMSLVLEDTGNLVAEVTPKSRDTYQYTYNGLVAGVTNLGQLTLKTGVFRFPVMAKNDEVTIDVKSNHPLQLGMVNATYEGLYVVRTRPV